MGEVHDGAATMDWMEQEQERGITITSAATTCFWREPPHQHHRHTGPCRLHHRGRAQPAGAGRRPSPCSYGVAGVEPQSETVWRQADKYRVPRICFVNKMDRVGADFFRCVDMIADRLGAVPLVTQLPLGCEAGYRGVIDLVRDRAVVWRDETLGAEYIEQDIPPDMAEQAAAYRASLIETRGRAGGRRARSLSRRRRARPGDAAPLPSAAAPSPAPSSRCSTDRRSRTRGSSSSSMRWSTTCRRRPTCRRSAASTPRAAPGSSAGPTTPSPSRRWPSRSWPIPSSAR